MLRVTVLIALLAGITIGYLLKGKLSNLANLNFRGLALLVSSFLLRFIVFRESFLTSQLAPQLGSPLYNLSNLLALAFLILNLNQKEIKIILAGALSNSLAIFLNGGKMPASFEALKQVHQEDLAIKISHYPWYPLSLVNPQTKLWYLGDVIPFRFPLKPLQAAISVGDILILAGLLVLIIKGMQKKN